MEDLYDLSKVFTYDYLYSALRFFGNTSWNESYSSHTLFSKTEGREICKDLIGYMLKEEQKIKDEGYLDLDSDKIDKSLIDHIFWKTNKLQDIDREDDERITSVERSMFHNINNSNDSNKESYKHFFKSINENNVKLREDVKNYLLEHEEFWFELFDKLGLE